MAKDLRRKCLTCAEWRFVDSRGLCVWCGSHMAEAWRREWSAGVCGRCGAALVWGIDHASADCVVQVPVLVDELEEEQSGE